MKEFLAVFVITLFAICEARPSAISQENVVPEKSAKIEETHTRVRRQGFDYEEYMTNFWKSMSRCKNCNILSIGNGYKNHNVIYVNKKPGSGSRKSGSGDPFDSPFFND